MDLKDVGKVMGATALVAATGGLAAPFLAAGALGSVVLAPVILGQLTAISTIGVVTNMAQAKKSKTENEKLREELKRANMDSKAKQKVIEDLNKQLDEVKEELRRERAKSKRNEERIQLMEEQIDDLMETLRVAYAA